MKKKYLMVAPLIGALMLTGCDKTPEAEPVTKEVMKENLSKTKKLVDDAKVEEKGLHLKGSQVFEVSGSNEETTITSTAKLGFEVKALTNKVHMHFDADAKGENKTSKETLTQSYSGSGDAYAKVENKTGDFAINYTLESARAGSSKKETVKQKASVENIDIIDAEFAESLITMSQASLAELSKELFEGFEDTFTASYNDKKVTFKYGKKKDAENYTIDGTYTQKIGDISLTLGERLCYVFDGGLINKFTAEIFLGLGTIQAKSTSTVEFAPSAKDFKLPDLADYEDVNIKQIELPDIGQHAPAE